MWEWTAGTKGCDGGDGDGIDRITLFLDTNNCKWVVEAVGSLTSQDSYLQSTDQATGSSPDGSYPESSAESFVCDSTPTFFDATLEAEVVEVI